MLSVIIQGHPRIEIDPCGLLCICMETLLQPLFHFILRCFQIAFMPLTNCKNMLVLHTVFPVSVFKANLFCIKTDCDALI